MRRLTITFLVLWLAVACDGSEESASQPGSDGASATTTIPGSTSTTAPPIVAASGECGLAGTYPTPWPDRPRYEVDLDVDPTGGVVTGVMRAAFTPPEMTDRLVLRLWANTPRVGEGGGKLEVTASSLGGEAVTGTYDDGGAGPGTPGTIYTITRAEPFAAGQRVEVGLDFTLTMPGAINERVARVDDSLRLGSIIPIFSWIRDKGWHTSPAVANFSEAVASEVADYDVRVRAPGEYTVLATGSEVEPHRFVASAVRDWAATVARMELAEGTADGGRIRVVVGAAAGTGDDPDERLADTIKSLETHASRYGPYPYPSLTVGITGSLSGGIEFPEHLFLGGDTSRDHLIHEVAHMWFYGLVGNDQYEHPWLDEGLTEFAESQFLGVTDAVRGQVIPSDAMGHLGESHAYWQGHSNSFYRGVYVQGAQALAAIGDEVGGLEAVDCSLRRYVLENAYSVAEPDDLIRAIQDQTGVDPRPVLERFGAP